MQFMASAKEAWLVAARYIRHFLMKTNISITVLLMSFTSLAYGNEMDAFGDVSEQYVGSCAGLSHLKSAYCPQIDSPTIDQCIVEVTQLLPRKLVHKFSKALNEAREEIQINSAIRVDKEFAKLREINNNDIEKSCLGYSSSLRAHSQMKLQEAKRLAKLKK